MFNHHDVFSNTFWSVKSLFRFSLFLAPVLLWSFFPASVVAQSEEVHVFTWKSGDGQKALFYPGTNPTEFVTIENAFCALKLIKSQPLAGVTTGEPKGRLATHTHETDSNFVISGSVNIGDQTWAQNAPPVNGDKPPIGTWWVHSGSSNLTQDIQVVCLKHKKKDIVAIDMPPAQHPLIQAFTVNTRPRVFVTQHDQSGNRADPINSYADLAASLCQHRGYKFVDLYAPNYGVVRWSNQADHTPSNSWYQVLLDINGGELTLQNGKAMMISKAWCR